MPRKNALSALLDEHQRQERVSASAGDAVKSIPASPRANALFVSSLDAAEVALSPAVGMFPARPTAGRPQDRHERDAALRMERVYEEVSRRKGQVVEGREASSGAVDTDGSCPPTAAAAATSEAMATAAATSRNSLGIFCTSHGQEGQVLRNLMQQKEDGARRLSMSRPRDRKRPRRGMKRVGFVAPMQPAVTEPSSCQTAGEWHVEMSSAGAYRQHNEEEEWNERRRERQQERRRRRCAKSSRKKPGNSNGREATLLDVDDATVQYIDAVLVKPDPQVFNKYTRFFLDPKLETLYQDFTAIYWLGRARWHVAVWMTVHLFVNLSFYAVPKSGFTGMEQFILSYDSLPAYFQWIYVPIALPFAALPNKCNPFQTRWRSWVCLIIIFFNLTFQIWLADAGRLASKSFASAVRDQLSCKASNPALASMFVGMNESSSGSDDVLTSDTISSALVYLEDEQIDLAIRVTNLCSDALVQTLVGFVSLFSFLFVISIRLEFVQVVVVAVFGAATYASVVSAFGLQLQWVITFAYGTAVILLLILSYSLDRTNRRSFLSNFLVEKENENLKSSLKQAEAALQNDAAHADEEREVARILAAPEMCHFEMLHIPFADLTFLQAIGRGSMGDVIKAKYFGTIVVCKRMRREYIVESSRGRDRNGSRDMSHAVSALASFRDEIELMSCLRHPNVVQFIGASWDNASNLCIVMEYMENGDMHRVLHSGLGKNFTWVDPLLKMAVDAVQGMLYLHSQERPVVHRDLKSVNILCSATFGCKVGDFGLSRRYKKGVDALTTLVGTPFWLAPEIIRSERYGPAADVYSFGIVLTELETRHTPYHDQEETGLKVLMKVAHKGLRPSLPPSCLPERRRLIEDCLRDVPARRPTFAQVLSRLQGPVLLEIEGHVATQPDLERRVRLRRHQERRSL